MTARRIASAAMLLAAALSSPSAHAADCDAERAHFPKNWTSLAGETPLLTCAGHYIRLRIFLTPRGETTSMLTVATDKTVYRAIVDARAIERIKQQAGLYILNSEKTCFIRGNVSSPAVLNFSDRSPGAAFSFFHAGNSLDVFYDCEPAK